MMELGLTWLHEVNGSQPARQQVLRVLVFADRLSSWFTAYFKSANRRPSQSWHMHPSHLIPSSQWWKSKELCSKAYSYPGLWDGQSFSEYTHMRLLRGSAYNWSNHGSRELFQESRSCPPWALVRRNAIDITVVSPSGGRDNTYIKCKRRTVGPAQAFSSCLRLPRHIASLFKLTQ